MTDDHRSIVHKKASASGSRRKRSSASAAPSTMWKRVGQDRRFWYSVFGIAVGIGAMAVFGYNLLPTIGPGFADPTNLHQVELGRSIYANACALCHGKNLEGQVNWRTRLPTGEYPAPPHDQDGHTWHHPDQILFRITKLGGQAEAPAGFKSNMPGFGNVYSDAEILAVLAYIKNRWPEHIRIRQAEINRRNQGR